MHISILGRLQDLSLAELERVYGSDKVQAFSKESAIIDSDYFDIEMLGGSQKAGVVVDEVASTDWQIIERHIIKHYTKTLTKQSGKITIGISAYGLKLSAKTVQQTGLKLKNSLKNRDGSVRLVPNLDAVLSSATSHHNKLGLSANKIEIIVVKGDENTTIIATSVGSQNITAYARRDQGRPKRDAFVGMLPPKLAQIMVNLAAGSRLQDSAEAKSKLVLLDPFCGTGVLLQEAALMGYSVYGTDLSEKMIDYTEENLRWLSSIKHLDIKPQLAVGDAMTTLWKKPIDFVVAESYLGQPFSAPPSPAKLHEVVGNCDHIIGSFLKNVKNQIKSDTVLCIAVPAWRNKDGMLTHLPLTRNLDKYGFKKVELTTVTSHRLIYFREDQVVARELLVITKA